MSNYKTKYISGLISVFAYAILTYIFIYYFRNINWQTISDTVIDWRTLCLAGFSFLGIRFLYPYIWIFLLKEFDQKISDYWELNFVYAKSWLGRYIPGKIAWVGGKIYFGSQQGLDVKILTLGSLLESIIQVIASLASGLFIISIYNKGVLGQKLVGFSFVSLVILFISIYPPFFNRFVSMAYKVVKRKEIEAKCNFRFSTLFKTFIMFVVISILTGVPSTLICLSVDSAFDIISNFFYLVAATSLAGSIGMLAVFAPSGLGVREGVLAIFFSALFSKEVILVVLIIMRLTATIVDLLFFLVSKIVLVSRSGWQIQRQ